MRFVAFLRAINVGGRNVKMEELRRIFDSIGLTNVESVITSGNVVFNANVRSAKAIEKKLEAMLQKSLGYAVATYVRSAEELAAIARHKPFKKIPTNGTLFIAFTSVAPNKAIRETLLSAQSGTDKFLFREREIYWLCLTRFSDSKFSGSSLEKILGVPVSVRNANTVARIASKLDAS